MMTFEVSYKNGTKRIRANDLDDAERICDERIKTWTDIRIVNPKEVSNELHGSNST